MLVAAHMFKGQPTGCDLTKVTFTHAWNPCTYWTKAELEKTMDVIRNPPNAATALGLARVFAGLEPRKYALRLDCLRHLGGKFCQPGYNWAGVLLDTYSASQIAQAAAVCPNNLQTALALAPPKQVAAYNTAQETQDKLQHQLATALKQCGEAGCEVLKCNAVISNAVLDANRSSAKTFHDTGASLYRFVQHASVRAALGLPAQQAHMVNPGFDLEHCVWYLEQQCIPGADFRANHYCCSASK
jgi:hypothetical protein